MPGQTIALPMQRLLAGEEPETEGFSLEVRKALFMRALARRLGGNLPESSNLYLTGFEIPQIELFDLLAHRMPLVPRARELANERLADSARGCEHVVLVDVGIGSGHQEVELLARLAAQNRGPARALRTLTLVAIDPAASSLEVARRRILAASRAHGIQVEFIAVAKAVEDVGEGEWRSWMRIGVPILVNAAFALHHVAQHRMLGEAGVNDLKDVVLRRIRSMDPRCFVLVEPDTDHQTSNFPARFRNCWRHFGLTFDYIDSLDLSIREKTALKTQFFGREIEDILAKPDAERTERHETAKMWAARLRRARFRLDGGPVGIEFRGETLVAVIHACA